MQRSHIGGGHDSLLELAQESLDLIENLCGVTCLPGILLQAIHLWSLCPAEAVLEQHFE